MVAMTSSCIAGRCGSNLSVIHAVLDQTRHTVSSSTSVWKAPLQVRSWISACESWVSAKTNARSKNSSRNVARCGSPGLRSSSPALLVVIGSPVLSASARVEAVVPCDSAGEPRSAAVAASATEPGGPSRPAAAAHAQDEGGDSGEHHGPRGGYAAKEFPAGRTSDGQREGGGPAAILCRPPEVW